MKNDKIVGAAALLWAFVFAVSGCVYSKSIPGSSTDNQLSNTTTVPQSTGASGATGPSGTAGTSGASGTSGDQTNPGAGGASGATTPAVASGGLDPSFGVGGKASFAYSNGSKSYDMVPGAMSLNPDGTFYVAGAAVERIPNTITNPVLFLARFKGDGNIDTSFGAGQGVILTSLNARASSMSSDATGRILVGGDTSYGAMMWGSQQSVLIRFLPDGTMDANFGDMVSGVRQGYVKGPAGDTLYKIAVLKDNTIFAMGERNPKTFIYCKLGSPCTTTLPDIFVAHYNEQGDLDNGFGANSGYQTLDFKGQLDAGLSLAVDETNGRIYVGGRTTTRSASSQVEAFLLARLKMSGAPDSGFGSDPAAPGMVVSSFGSQTAELNDMALEKDGHIVAVGFIQNPATNSKDFLVARFSNDGTPDTAFNGQGYTIMDFGKDDVATSVVVLDDNRAVVGGSSTDAASGLGDFALCRILPAGQIDTTFGTGGLVTTDFSGGNDTLSAMFLQTDGKIVAAGINEVKGQPTQVVLARYLP